MAEAFGQEQAEVREVVVHPDQPTMTWGREVNPLQAVNRYLRDGWRIVAVFPRTHVFYTGHDGDIRQEERETVYVMQWKDNV